MRILLLGPFLLCAPTLSAQHLKYLDYQELYAKAGVESEYRYTYNCENNQPVDSCAFGIYQFNREGRITRIVDHFACGRVFSDQTFEYDREGHLVRNTIRHAFNQMNPVEIDLIRDENGFVVERIPEKRIPNYWICERIQRDDLGHIRKVTHYRREGSNVRVFWEQTYPDLAIEWAKRQRNNLTDVYDQQGLQLLHHVYDRSGLQRITKHNYTFY